VQEAFGIVLVVVVVLAALIALASWLAGPSALISDPPLTEASSSSSAARAISQQRRAWAEGSGSTRPSGHTGAVPETETVLPTRTARLKPIEPSNGDPERARRRSMESA